VKITKYIQALSSNEQNIKTNPFVKDLIKLMPDYVKASSSYLVFHKNEFIFRKGELPRYVYYIIDGSFIVVNEFESGKVYEPVVLHSNDFTGTVEAILHKSEIISANIANEDLYVFQFPIDVFLRWINDSHPLTKVVLEKLSMNFEKNMMESGEGILLHSMYFLISHLLNQSYEKDGLSVLDEAREKTAIRTGINIRTLYRHIKELKNENYIKTNGRKILFTEDQRQKLYDYQLELRNK
jgi:CRP-like cAMP-binding protein